MRANTSLMRRSLSASAIVAAITVLTGLVAAAGAVGWSAVTRTDPASDWRGLEGTFASLSISFALAAVLFGVITVIGSDRGSGRSAIGTAGFALAAATLGYWIWLSHHLG
jgi:hypothetical protein